MNYEWLYQFMQKIPYLGHNGIVVDCIETDHAVLHVDMRPELANPYGMAHGGLLFTLIDTAAGAVARTDGREYVTLNANANYLRNTTAGRITADAHLVRRGKTATVVDVAVTDEKGTLLTTGTVTMFCLNSDEKPALV